MKIEELNLAGAFYIEPKLFPDDRGYFYEFFNQQAFHNETGVKFQAVQFNCSKSSYGVLRGLHFQQDPKAQAKLVSVTSGEIQDVIVDLRKGSPTFGKSRSIILSSQNKNQLFVPKGFAHGFLVLSNEAEIFYAIDDFYSPQHEGGIMYNDPLIDVEWQMESNQLIMSDKDLVYKSIEDTTLNFNY
ncbi:MAG: dTDP-4-dehydrorhamnose 3,5-epimerase [Reichenbachiella sp.]|uniref:dTDP-4-dehydrorhamnose 3,5-epimerase n=1 Tax=Reichenbachiella sp. TaxID=2184521 RepID=UPI00326624E4